MASEAAFPGLGALIGLIQQKYVMRLLGALLAGPSGFNELRRAVKSGSPNTIAARLSELERFGLIRKTVLSLQPPRNQYEMTEAGLAFRAPMFALRAWAHSHLSAVAAQAQEPFDVDATVFDLVQEKWTVPLVRALLAGPAGFNELSRALGTTSASLIASRLERLERLKVVEKTVLSVQPPRHRYALTPAGRQLQQVFAALQDWAQIHLPASRLYNA